MWLIISSYLTIFRNRLKRDPQDFISNVLGVSLIGLFIFGAVYGISYGINHWLKINSYGKLLFNLVLLGCFSKLPQAFSFAYKNYFLAEDKDLLSYLPIPLREVMGVRFITQFISSFLELFLYPLPVFLGLMATRSVEPLQLLGYFILLLPINLMVIGFANLILSAVYFTLGESSIKRLIGPTRTLLIVLSYLLIFTDSEQIAVLLKRFSLPFLPFSLLWELFIHEQYPSFLPLMISYGYGIVWIVSGFFALLFVLNKAGFTHQTTQQSWSKRADRPLPPTKTVRSVEPPKLVKIIDFLSPMPMLVKDLYIANRKNLFWSHAFIPTLALIVVIWQQKIENNTAFIGISFLLAGWIGLNTTTWALGQENQSDELLRFIPLPMKELVRAKTAFVFVVLFGPILCLLAYSILSGADWQTILIGFSSSLVWGVLVSYNYLRAMIAMKLHTKQGNHNKVSSYLVLLLLISLLSLAAFWVAYLPAIALQIGGAIAVAVAVGLSLLWFICEKLFFSRY